MNSQEPLDVDRLKAAKDVEGLGRKDYWLPLPLVFYVIGYVVPNPHWRVWPVEGLAWEFSMVELLIPDPMLGTPEPFFAVLWLLPLVLACLGWAGFALTSNVHFLRLGFYAAWVLGIGYCAASIFMLLFADFMFPLNGIAFLASALTAHQVKRSMATSR
ncbi:MAG: hypothetical protein ACFFCO_10785 [Promethearchaeota archaeon]